MVLRVNMHAHVSALRVEWLNVLSTPVGRLLLRNTRNHVRNVTSAVELVLLIDDVRPVTLRLVAKINVFSQNVVNDALSRLFILGIRYILERLRPCFEKSCHATRNEMWLVKRRLDEHAES